MAVTVITARDEHGGPTTRELYAAATKYVISDGNLDVIVQGAGPLGTYASGNWLSVYMDDSVEITTIKSEDSGSGDFGDFGFDDDSGDSGDESTSDFDTDSSDDTLTSELADDDTGAADEEASHSSDDELAGAGA
jgi:hypothetical protein